MRTRRGWKIGKLYGLPEIGTPRGGISIAPWGDGYQVFVGGAQATYERFPTVTAAQRWAEDFFGIDTAPVRKRRRGPESFRSFEIELARKFLRRVGDFSAYEEQRLDDREVIEVARNMRPPWPLARGWSNYLDAMCELEARRAYDYGTAVNRDSLPGVGLRYLTTFGVADAYGPQSERIALSADGRKLLKLSRRKCSAAGPSRRDAYRSNVGRRAVTRGTWKKVGAMYVEPNVGAVIEKQGGRWVWALESGVGGSTTTLAAAKTAALEGYRDA